MGSSSSKQDQTDMTDSQMINETEVFIKNTKARLNDNHNPEIVGIKKSIESDLCSIDHAIHNGNPLRVGIIGRNSQKVKDLANIFYMTTEVKESNTVDNLFIASSKKNMLHEKPADESISKVMDYHLGTYATLPNKILKFTNYLPTPRVFHENCTFSVSSSLKMLTDELEFDDLTKFLLYSMLHDLLIYIPGSDYVKEFSFIDYLSDNHLILNLLRRNSFHVIIDKHCPRVSKEIKENFLIKLQNAIITELNYEDANKDKMIFLGVLIEKYGPQAISPNASYHEISEIKNRFQTFLKEEHEKFIKQKEQEETKRFAKSTSKNEANPISFDLFKSQFIQSFPAKFSSSSGIEAIEDNIYALLMRILSQKVNLLKSNISFKLMILNNFDDIHKDMEFTNSLFISRNELVNEMKKSFNNITEIYKKAEEGLLSSTENLLQIVELFRAKAIPENNLYERDYFWDIFNISGDFVPYNNFITEVRREYYQFNQDIFQQLTRLSNACHAILEILLRTITTKLSVVFNEIEKRSKDMLVQNFIHNNNNSLIDIHQDHALEINELMKEKLKRLTNLSLYFYSIFGKINFTMETNTRTYLFPSYCGSAIGGLLLAFGLKELKFSSIFSGAATLSISFFIAHCLKKFFMWRSRRNFLSNSENMKSFIIAKKDKIVNFPNELNEFLVMYSKESLELLDLILKIN